MMPRGGCQEHGEDPLWGPRPETDVLRERAGIPSHIEDPSDPTSRERNPPSRTLEGQLELMFPWDGCTLNCFPPGWVDFKLLLSTSQADLWSHWGRPWRTFPHWPARSGFENGSRDCWVLQQRRGEGFQAVISKWLACIWSSWSSLPFTLQHVHCRPLCSPSPEWQGPEMPHNAKRLRTTNLDQYSVLPTLTDLFLPMCNT